MQTVELVRYLHGGAGVPVDALARTFDASVRTVRAHIHEANAALDGVAAIVFSRASRGYRLRVDDERALTAWLERNTALAGTASRSASEERAASLLSNLLARVAIPLMFSVVVDRVPHERMGLMMGCASLITALAPAVGSSYGGLVMGIAGWRWVFLALIPLVVLAAAVGTACLRQATPVGRPRFDAMGFALMAAGFTALVCAMNAASSHGWLSAPVLALAAGSVAALGLYARHARRAANPLIDVALFACAPFTCEVLVVALVSFAILGFAYLVPNYAQLALQADALTAGVLLLPGCVASVLLGPAGGRLLDRAGARVPIAAGMALIVGACALFAVLAGVLTPTLMAGVYVAFGAGQGLASSTSMTYGMAQLPEAQRTAGNSVFNTLQQLGGSLGVSVVTAVVGAAQEGAPNMAEATAAGGAAAFAVLAVVAAAAALLSWAALRQR